MPQPGKRWRHIDIHTHNSWLPADPRGFRNRGHRIHSSGDYKSPPPAREHEGLRLAIERQAGDRVRIPNPLRALVGQTIIDNLTDHGHQVVCLAVDAVHAHILVELPDSPPAIRRIIGWAKQKSSTAISHSLPGQIWSDGCSYKPVDNKPHQRSVYRYIPTKQGRSAWTWDFK